MALGTTEFTTGASHRDLKLIFEPRRSGDAAVAATGFYDTDDGKDLADIFAPLAAGQRISGNTGFTVKGTDLADIFCALYTRPDEILKVSVPTTASGSCSTSGSSCVAQATVQASAGGGFPSYRYNWSIVSGGASIVSGENTDTITLKQTTSGNPKTVVKCRVTDSHNGAATSNECMVTLHYDYVSDLTLSVPGAVDTTCSSSAMSCTASKRVTCTASKGRAPYNYAWEASSGVSITAGRHSATVAVAKSVSGDYNGYVRCRVTDAGGKKVASEICTVRFHYKYVDDLRASVPSSLSTAYSGSQTTGTCGAVIPTTVRGGKPPYTYSWEHLSGLDYIVPRYSAHDDALVVGDHLSRTEYGKWRCKVTDSIGYSVYTNVCTVTYNYRYIDNLAVSIPSSRSAACSTSASSCTASVSIAASISGGRSPYSYHWERVSGSGSVTSGGTGSSCTVAASTSGATSGTFRCRVTDSIGYVKYSNNCTVSFDYTYTGTSYGGGGFTGGGGCIQVDEWIDIDTHIRAARVGARYDVLINHRNVRLPLVKHKGVSLQPCVRIVTASGAAVRISADTPVNLKTATVDLQIGHMRLARDMQGYDIGTLHDSRLKRWLRETLAANLPKPAARWIQERCAPVVRWERVIKVEDIGKQYVAYLSFNGQSYAAGSHPCHRIYAHNTAGKAKN